MLGSIVVVSERPARWLLPLALAGALGCPTAPADDDGASATSGEPGTTGEPGTSSEPGTVDDGATATDGGEQFPDCPAPTAEASPTVTIDGALLDPLAPPSSLPFVDEGACTITSAGAGSVTIDCPDVDGVAHAFELDVDASPAVALPELGAAVSLSFTWGSDDLSDALESWGATLRDPSGALLLAVGGGHGVGLPGLEASLGPEDVCPYQEIDEVACEAYRRTSIALDVDGTALEAFDHTSFDAADGSLRMVVGDAVWRTVSPDFNPDTCSGGGLGPGFGRFGLVIGPPA